jgi:hypothetical protein
MGGTRSTRPRPLPHTTDADLGEEFALGRRVRGRHLAQLGGLLARAADHADGAVDVPQARGQRGALLRGKVADVAELPGEELLLADEPLEVGGRREQQGLVRGRALVEHPRRHRHGRVGLVLALPLGDGGPLEHGRLLGLHDLRGGAVEVLDMEVV